MRRPTGPLLLEMRGIEKSFPGVKALDRAELRVYGGGVMALLGENGAGKSTLIKIMAGIYRRDAGEILLDGRPMPCGSVRESQAAGVAVIHQELNLVPQMSAAENIFLGREPVGALGRLDRARMEREARELLRALDMHESPRTLVKDLTIGKRQLVEIAKALSQDARILVLDEPTGALTDNETRCLFRVIRGLAARGKGIVYISHRLKEIPEICDRVTIMRDGRFITEEAVEDAAEAFIIEKMVGRPLEEQYPKVSVPLGDEVLRVSHLTGPYAQDVSFSLRRGEVLGLAGLMGSGRTELVRTLCGSLPKTSGEVFVAGRACRIASPGDALRYGLAYVSEDRKGIGLILGMNVRENMTLSALKRFSALGPVRMGEERAAVQDFVQAFRIKTPSQEQAVRNLSGGNQQKVAIAKALLTRPSILILDEPTRGVDVGAKKEIYDVINELKREGLSLIVVSSEMPELMGLSDRILVVCEGAISGTVSREDFDPERIMRLALPGAAQADLEPREARI